MLYVSLRAVDSLKVLFTPFLPHTSQQLHELLGYDGWLAGPLEFREVAEAEGRSHEVLTGDYASWTGGWQPSVEHMKLSPVSKDEMAAEMAPLRSMFSKSVVARSGLTAGSTIRHGDLTLTQAGHRNSGRPVEFAGGPAGAPRHRSRRVSAGFRRGCHGDGRCR